MFPLKNLVHKRLKRAPLIKRDYISTKCIAHVTDDRHHLVLAVECNVDDCQICNATGACETCDDGYKVKNGICDGKYVFITKSYPLK